MFSVIKKSPSVVSLWLTGLIICNIGYFGLLLMKSEKLKLNVSVLFSVPSFMWFPIDTDVICGLKYFVSSVNSPSSVNSRIVRHSTFCWL